MVNFFISKSLINKKMLDKVLKIIPACNILVDSIIPKFL